MVASYRVLTGIDYPPGKRAEAGSVVDDLPGKSVKWLVDCGAIEKIDGKASKTKAVEPVEVVEEVVLDEGEDAAQSPWGAVADEGDED